MNNKYSIDLLIEIFEGHYQSLLEQEQELMKKCHIPPMGIEESSISLALKEICKEIASIKKHLGM